MPFIRAPMRPLNLPLLHHERIKPHRQLQQLLPQDQGAHRRHPLRVLPQRPQKSSWLLIVAISP